MSEQPLDLRRSLRILRRRLTAVTLLAVAGFLAGAGYTYLFDQPMRQATALVVLPASTSDTGTQAVIVTSGPVLDRALPSIKPAMSVLALRDRITVTSVGSFVFSIMAQGPTEAQAVTMANAVADSYVGWCSGR
jgi:capsular polysaccharide biosynthesis protein